MIILFVGVSVVVCGSYFLG